MNDAPASFSTPYRGMGVSSKGVRGMLDVILSDFVWLGEEAASEEESAAREFSEFSDETAADRGLKADTLDGKEKAQSSKNKERNQVHKWTTSTRRRMTERGRGTGRRAGSHRRRLSRGNPGRRVVTRWPTPRPEHTTTRLEHTTTRPEHTTRPEDASAGSTTTRCG